MSIKRKFRRDMKSIETPEIGRILPGADPKKDAAGRKRRARRTVAAPLALILSCLLVIGAAAAAVPAIIRYLNADVLAENNRQLKKVPEGYIGIYTAEDLDGIRNYFAQDIYAADVYNFILMNDITFTDADYAPGGIAEGGWKPIRSQFYVNDLTGFHDGFDGIFNGNGYVIRNLKIKAGGATEYAGLFGYTGASFINLGIEGCEINVTRAVADDSALCVGAIAGRAEFIGGCYASDVTVVVDLDTTLYIKYPDALNPKYYTQRYYVGGLGGYVRHVDSCYADAKIFVAESGDAVADIRVGGLAGASTSCVTSYSTGEISVDASRFYSCQTDPITVSDAGSRLPVLIGKESAERMFKICEKYYGTLSFDYKKINAYFLLKDPANPRLTDWSRAEFEKWFSRTVKQYYFTEDVSDIRAWYVFDPTATPNENNIIAELISEAFGGYDNFQKFCIENRIKCGILYCYSFDEGATTTEADLEAFNFETIWVIKNGKALPRIFES